MGLSGDSLAVFCLLAGGALTTAVGALSTQGRVRLGLWIATGIFMVATAALWFTNNSVSWGPLLPFAYALMPPVIVGVVALVVRSAATASKREVDSALSEWRTERIAANIMAGLDKPAPKKAASDAERLGAKVASRWSPDWKLKQVAGYLVNKANWYPEYGGPDEENLAKEIHRALWRGELDGWAKLHPDDGQEILIEKGHWDRCDLERLDGYAFFTDLKLPVYDIRVSSGQMKTVWPSKS